MLSKQKLKFVKSLHLKKFRTTEQLFICEGIKIVEDLFISNFEIVEIFATKNWIENYNNSKRKHTVIEITESELKQISQLVSPNEVLAVVKIPQIEFDTQKIKFPILLLDNINDPGNLGTLIRICDWFGWEQIICSNDTVDCFNSKVVQSAKGSLFRTTLFYHNLVKILDQIIAKHTDARVFLADMNGEDLETIKFPLKSIIVLGNEANGISNDLKFFKNSSVINIKGKGRAESLNVGVAGGIIINKVSNSLF